MDEFDWIDSVSIAESTGLGIDLLAWLPERDRQEFEKSEQRLIAQYGIEQVKEWLSAYHFNLSQTGEYLRQMPIPPEVRHDVSILHLILVAIDAGPERGLPMLVGDEEARQITKSGKFSQGGSPKKGKIYEPASSIKIICKEIDSFAYNDVLEFLKDADKCLDIYESTTHPTGVLFLSVDEDEEAKRFGYVKRGDNPDKIKYLSFKRLSNILANLKK